VGAQDVTDELATAPLLDLLFEEAPVGLAFFSRAGRYLRLNAALAEINGVPAHAHLGRTVEEVLPDMDPRVSEALATALQTGEPVIGVDLEGRTPAAEERRTWRCSFYPVRRPDGLVIGVGAVVDEVTERRQAERERAELLGRERAARLAAERAAQRMAFLAEASAILDAALDVDGTLQAIAGLAVARLADVCVVHMVDGSGGLVEVARSYRETARGRVVEEVERRWPLREDAQRGAPAVVRSGRPELYPEITDELLRDTAHDAEHLAALRAFGLTTAMVVPLVARGRTLGALTLVSAEPGRRFEPADLALAQELARRGAVSVDNARLYEESRATARTLQDSLLPPALPDVPGVEVTVRYHAAGPGNRVGGDFYDLYPLADRRAWALTIGDVCGKGAEAAALTALARYTLRAALDDPGPRQALERLNEAMVRQRADHRFATLAHAHLRWHRDRPMLRLCRAGHPAPLLLRADGSAAPLGPTGSLLGVLPDPTLQEVEVALGPGDTLVFYTDGLLEASHERPLTEDALAEQLAGSPPGTAALAERLEALAGLGEPEGPRDDVALLIVALR
jgi:PAS domain S-box-containing protein